VEVGAAFGDDEAVACACEIADIGAAVEGFEETGEVSGGDADALVGDGEDGDGGTGWAAMRTGVPRIAARATGARLRSAGGSRGG
jgi:hypothetical protein